jgi:hypothetical protein
MATSTTMKNSKTREPYKIIKLDVGIDSSMAVVCGYLKPKKSI